MLNARHFLVHVIRPTLRLLDIGGPSSLSMPAAQVLLLGTALAETRLEYLRQIGGPGLSIYSIEPATRRDVYDNFLVYRTELMFRVDCFASKTGDLDQQLAWNLAYATAIARMVYYRRPEALPEADDAVALSHFHKRHFNTVLGKADPDENVAHFRRAIEVAT